MNRTIQCSLSNMCSLLLIVVWTMTTNVKSFILPATISRSHGAFLLNNNQRLWSKSIGDDTTIVNTDNDTSTTAAVGDWIEESFRDEQQQENNNNPTVVPLLNTKNDNVIIGPKNVLIYDTSLRDGTQMESISVSCEDKLKIATELGTFGMDYIEGGWPGSNPKDAEFFQRAKTELSKDIQSKLVAFGSTRRKNIKAKDDKQIQALLDSGVPAICIVAKAHPGQVQEILRTTLDENLNMIYDSIQYLTKEHNKTVLVDLEHFFDGYKTDSKYILECCNKAVDAGASCLVLCDTNGGTMPWEMSKICNDMVSKFHDKCTIGIHCHNDCNMAVSNSCISINEGIGLIQGTMNGIGERTGNADLCSIIPNMALHSSSNMNCRNKLSELTSLSRYIDELLNRTPNSAAPYVGSSAFAHKGGLHVAAIERNPFSYQHIDPIWVGNEKRILISELSGRQNIMGKLQENLSPDDANNESEDGSKTISDRAIAILNRVKELEHQGYTFEGAEASVDLMILHSTKGYCPPFSVLDYSAHVYDDNMDSANRIYNKYNMKHTPKNSKKMNQKQKATSRATVKVRTTIENSITKNLESKDILEVSEGNGPVDALSKALLRALIEPHPYLLNVELVDYKVRILDPKSATGAATRVLIEFKDTLTDKQWTTVSVDVNVISASLNALVDGFEYALIEHASHCMLCDDDDDDE